MLFLETGVAFHSPNPMPGVARGVVLFAAVSPSSDTSDSWSAASVPIAASPSAPAPSTNRLPSHRPRRGPGCSARGSGSGATLVRCAGMYACVSYEADTDRSSRISSSGVGRSSGSLARQRSTSGARFSGSPVKSGSSWTTW